MVVRKILEQTLSAGSTSVIFTDAEIPNSLLRVFSSNADIIPVSRTISGTSLTVTYEPQTSNIDVAVEIVKAGLDIVDDLTSTDTDKALSAKQGKALKDIIDALPPVLDEADEISYDNTDTGMTATNVQSAIDEVFQSVSDGKVLIADAITDKGVPTSADDTFSTMAENIESISGGGLPTNVTAQKVLVGGTVTGYGAGQASVNITKDKVCEVILDFWLWCPNVTQAGTVYITINGVDYLVTDYTYYTYTDAYHAIRHYVKYQFPSISITSVGYKFSGMAYNTASQFHGEVTIIYENE